MRKLLMIVISLIVIMIGFMSVKFSNQLDNYTVQDTTFVDPIVDDSSWGVFSKHAILVDLKDNKILYAREADERTYPASLTKMMTVLVAIENLSTEMMKVPNDFSCLYEQNAALAGFLPGDLQSKVDPYLRPLYDALNQIMGPESFVKNSEKGLIEVAPLAYMRGRTLDNSFIILDEAQNTTPAQMKMFLTRVGFGSKVVVTGDLTQKDLPITASSGLENALKILKKVEGIGFSYLTNKDVVRHPLVQRIVKAYDDYDLKEERKRQMRKERHDKIDRRHSHEK